MPHPVCGKCKSSGVYSDRNERGQLIVCCLICGNSSESKAGKGFYMSDKQPLNALQSSVKSENSINVDVSACESIDVSDRIYIEIYEIDGLVKWRMCLK